MFTTNDNKIWGILFSRQISNIRKFACKEFLAGFDALSLPSSRVPSEEEINDKLVPATGWEAVITRTRYLTDHQWAEHMARRKFPITNYIRTESELDFTPEPDIFHDAFGHLPLLMNPDVAKLIETFSVAYGRASSDELKKIAQLWWNTVEFGLKEENGTRKAFGAGLMSSQAEIKRAVGGNALVRPFSIQLGIESERAVASLHSAYLAFESVKKLDCMLEDFFNLEVIKVIR
jgi:phenylalanine-4-hydroxylase